ncbi:hypothetical protein ACLOJK_029663, partial [Asimina triloba]
MNLCMLDGRGPYDGVLTAQESEANAMKRLFIDAEDVRERPLLTIFAQSFSFKRELEKEAGNRADRDGDRGRWERKRNNREEEGRVICKSERKRENCAHKDSGRGRSKKRGITGKKKARSGGLPDEGSVNRQVQQGKISRFAIYEGSI